MVVGGLLKSTSRLALVAAAGILVGGISLSPAKAADLGGDCCADLEERIAELEATTVRKGNRKVSLTISGQVNRAIMYWNDGFNGDVYSVDNTNSSTRFRFTGGAKIHATLQAGYAIEIELVHGARADAVTQFDDDGRDTTTGFGDTDTLLRLRQANWWLEHKQLGRLTVGRQSSAGDGAYGLDLGEIAGTATSSDRGAGDSLYVRAKGVGGEQGLTSLQMKSLVGAALVMGRFEGVRWDSPTLAGFTVSASWGEDDQWDAALRYAGEFSGLRIVAALAYAKSFDEEADSLVPNADSGRTDRTEWAASASAWHVPTGIFVNVSYRQTSFDGTNSGDLVARAAADALVQRADVKQLWIAAGIKKNFFGVGFTSLYGEYQKSDNYAQGQVFATLGGGGSTVGYVSGSEATIWGLGIVQQIDAAALELYLSYRHISFDVSSCSAATTAATCVAPTKVALEDLDLILAGARIKF